MSSEMHNSNTDEADPVVNNRDVKEALPPKEELPITIRSFHVSDTNLVLSNWLKSFRNESWAASTPNDVYFPLQQKLIGQIAARSQVFVACAVDNPAEVWGWICCEQGPEDSLIVHYVYVKEMFRKFGVGKMLLHAAGWLPGAKIWATHSTFKSQKMARRINITHNPFLLLLDK